MNIAVFSIGEKAPRPSSASVSLKCCRFLCGFPWQTHGSLIYALMHIDFLHLYPVSP
jgi:hypothetical protein